MLPNEPGQPWDSLVLDDETPGPPKLSQRQAVAIAGVGQLRLSLDHSERILEVSHLLPFDAHLERQTAGRIVFHGCDHLRRCAALSPCPLELMDGIPRIEQLSDAARDLLGKGATVACPPSLEERLTAAQRHLALDTPWAALEELIQTGIEHFLDVRVLSLRAETFAAFGSWESVALLSSLLCEKVPADPKWPVWLAHARRYAHSVEAGLEAIRKEADRFPDHPAMAYHMARMECVLGRVDIARQHLAFTLQAAPAYLPHALADPDLAALHGEIR